MVVSEKKGCVWKGEKEVSRRCRDRCWSEPNGQTDRRIGVIEGSETVNQWQVSRPDCARTQATRQVRVWDGWLAAGIQGWFEAAVTQQRVARFLAQGLGKSEEHERARGNIDVPGSGGG